MLTHVFEGLDTLQWTTGVSRSDRRMDRNTTERSLLRGIAKEFEYVAAYRHFLCLYWLIDRRVYFIHRQQLRETVRLQRACHKSDLRTSHLPPQTVLEA